MQALPMIIAAAGTVASMSAQQQQAREQRGILNRQLERDEQATNKSTAMVQDEGQRFSQQARQEALQGAEDKTYQQTQNDLSGAGGANIAAAASAGNVSDDFLKTKAARAIEEGTRLTSIAREAAKARAPGQVQMDDSLSLADLSGNLQNLWGSTKNMARANGMAASSVQEPGYGALGKIATAVGGGLAASGYGQTTGMEGGIPPNPYVTGPYRAGINFGAR